MREGSARDRETVGDREWDKSETERLRVCVRDAGRVREGSGRERDDKVVAAKG